MRGLISSEDVGHYDTNQNCDKLQLHTDTRICMCFAITVTISPVRLAGHMMVLRESSMSSSCGYVLSCTVTHLVVSVQLIQEKQELADRCEKLASQVAALEERHKQQLGAQRDRHREELQVRRAPTPRGAAGETGTDTVRSCRRDWHRHREELQVRRAPTPRGAAGETGREELQER